VPKLIEHYREGRFPFDRLIEYFPFSRIADALTAGADGSVIKPVVRM